METIRSLMLFLYMLSIFVGVAGLTITILADHKKRSKKNRAIKIFIIGLVVTNFYDFLLYYKEYQLFDLPEAFSIRFGCCIIALLSCLWINLQYEIVNDETTKFLRTSSLAYSIAYAALWLLLALLFHNVSFNALRWILTATDILFLLIVTLTSVTFMSKSVTTDKKESVNYQLLVTALIVWNYIAFAWGETANNLNIGISSHVPLDMTIIFWFVVNAATIFFILRTSFSEAFAIQPPETMEAENAVALEPDRIFDEIQEVYSLTDREKELCHFIYDGKSNSQISESLFITESTVKTHIYNLYRKTGVKSRMEIIKIVRDQQNSES